MRSLGIVVALPQERRWLPGAPGQTRIVVCGIGETAARRTAIELVDGGAAALVSWGSAAGLDPDLAAGSIVVPRQVRASAGRAFDVSDEWRCRLAERVGDRVELAEAPIAHADAVLADPPAKEALRLATDASAADMESAAVAVVAAERGLPFLVVRAIVDPARMAVPDRLIDGRGGVRLLRLLLRPRWWPTVLRLGFNFGTAGRRMREVWRLSEPALGFFDKELG